MFVYVCMYVCTYIRTHACMYVCVCVCINVRMYLSYVRRSLCMHDECTYSYVIAMRAISVIIMNATKKIRCQRDFL